MAYSFKTRGVCASTINFELNDGIVSNVSFIGGCNGNLKAISKLIEGMEAQKVISLLKGNKCGFKNTSCTDQLTIALEQALSKQSGN
ncbi:MAG: TIGR03905 family TSCPD domain-containing protein [Ruminococcaceae bacterium]|nr:TIGR03905 family TSCPD domain-containing protein [Oscillospiraceae bacterium]